MLSLFLSFCSTFSLCIYEGTVKNPSECDQTAEFMYMRNYESEFHFDEIILSKIRRTVTVPMSILSNNVTINVNDYEKDIIFSSNKMLESYPTLNFEKDIKVTLSGVLPMNYNQITGISSKPIMKFTRMIIKENTTITQTKDDMFAFQSKHINNELVEMQSPAFLLLDNASINIATSLENPESKVTIEVAPDSHCFVSSELSIEDISVGKGSSLFLDNKTYVAPLASIAITFSFDHLSYLDVQNPIEGETPFISITYEEDKGSQRFTPSVRVAHINVPSEWMQMKVKRNGGSWNKRKIDYDFNIHYDDGYIDVESIDGRYCTYKDAKLCENFMQVDKESLEKKSGIRFLKIDEDVSLDLEQINGGLYVEGSGVLTLNSKGSQVPKLTTNGTKVVFTGDLAFDGESFVDCQTELNILHIVTKREVYIDVITPKSLKVSCNDHSAVFSFKENIVIDAHDNDYVQINGNGFEIKELELQSKIVSMKNVIVANLLCYCGTSLVFDTNNSFTADGTLSVSFHVNKRPIIIFYEALKQIPNNIFISYNRKDDFPSDDKNNQLNPAEIMYGAVENIKQRIAKESFYFDCDDKLIRGKIVTTNSSIILYFARQQIKPIYAEKVCYKPGNDGKCPQGFKQVKTMLMVSNVKEMYIASHCFIKSSQLYSYNIKVDAPSPNDAKDPMFRKQSLWLSVLVDKNRIATLESENVNAYIYNMRGRLETINHIISTGKNTLYANVGRITAKKDTKLVLTSPAFLSPADDLIIESGACVNFVNGIESGPRKVQIKGMFDQNKAIIEGCDREIEQKIDRKCFYSQDFNNRTSVFVLNEEEL